MTKWFEFQPQNAKKLFLLANWIFNLHRKIPDTKVIALTYNLTLVGRMQQLDKNTMCISAIINNVHLFLFYYNK